MKKSKEKVICSTCKTNTLDKCPCPKVETEKVEWVNQPEVQKWIDQGRDKEHIYAVKNFLTGQGAVMVERLLLQEKAETNRWIEEARTYKTMYEVYEQRAEEEKAKWKEEARKIITIIDREERRQAFDKL